jgi:hypothetical protein
MNSAASKTFDVRFSPTTARVVECTDASGTIQFTVDSGSNGDKSVCLEHHPLDWPRGERYTIAFGDAKRFLESCGFEVEIYGRA